MGRLGRRAGMAAGPLCALLLTGCASAHVFTVPRATSDVACLMALPEQDVLVGVALSGGGSRAALFGAAGREAVSGLRSAAGSSVAEEITHISSVSGGSLAASYYALKFRPRDAGEVDEGGDGSVGSRDGLRRRAEIHRVNVSSA